MSIIMIVVFVAVLLVAGLVAVGNYVFDVLRPLPIED